MLKVRLYRPFSAAHLLAALPASARAIAVLDRTKEPGALGEPLYLDVRDGVRGSAGQADRAAARSSSAAATACRPRSSRRRWLAACSTSWRGRRRATTSPSASSTTSATRRSSGTATLDIEPDDVSRSVFFGLGADGTVGANKNSIKIIGDATTEASRRATSSTTRRSPARSPSRTCASARRRSGRPYLIRQAGFVGCHQFGFLDRYDVLDARRARRGAARQQPVRPGRRSGISCRRGAGRHPREAAAALRDRRRSTWPAATAWARASTRSCRRASSRCPACCRATRRSSASRTRSRRPTPSAAPTSCGRTSTRSTTRWRTCTRCRCPAAVASDRAPAARGAGRTRPTSSRASRR